MSLVRELLLFRREHRCCYTLFLEAVAVYMASDIAQHIVDGYVAHLLHDIQCMLLRYELVEARIKQVPQLSSLSVLILMSAEQKTYKK